MKCYDARRMFGAYWDDEITQAERERLEAHFAECAECRAGYEAFARPLETLAALPRHEAAPDFVERTLARARRATPMADRVVEPRPVWAPVLAAAAVVIVAAVALAPWLGRNASRTAVNVRTPQEARLVSQPLPAGAARALPGRPAGVTATTPASPQGVAALVDSLIDHSEDVDFVLDPVRVSRGRTAGRRLEPAGGHPTVISF